MGRGLLIEGLGDSETNKAEVLRGAAGLNESMSGGVGPERDLLPIFPLILLNQGGQGLVLLS